MDTAGDSYSASSALDLSGARRGKSIRELEYCVNHGEACLRSNCPFKEDHCVFPRYFENPPLSEDSGDVPDSYQPGHGIDLVKLPAYESSCEEGSGAYCTVIVKGLTVNVRCKCKSPGLHPWLVDLFCKKFCEACVN